MDLAGCREARKAAIGAGDHILPTDGARKARDALGDCLWVLDKIRAVRDHAGYQSLALGQFELRPNPPLVLVPGVSGLKGISTGIDPQHDVDNVREFEVVHPRTHIDAVAGVIAHP